MALLEPSDSEGTSPVCDLDVHIEAALKTDGVPIRWSRVRLDASNAKILVTEPDPERVMVCRTTGYSLWPNNFRWELLSRPAGSTVSLSGTSTLYASLTPDRIGEYKVRFTGCPDGCEVTLLNGAPFHVSSDTRELTITALDAIILPPETEPEVPLEVTTPRTESDGSEKCGFAIEPGVTDPQWVTVNEWNGPGDYELLEGRVLDSHISRIDSPLNHDSNDHLLFVKPDPKYNRLRPREPYQDDIEVEWERYYYPPSFRATRGDRVSVWGYWIHDCGHDAKTEIHPPVLVAVHRPRAIQIPASLGYGSGIYVPGIVTDLWINRDAGEMTRTCGTTGLHQPYSGGCLPQSEGFVRNPINRVFEFSIYLPRDPQDLMEEIGRTAPPVPLYRGVFDPHASGGPDPEITVQEKDGITYLRVRLDLETPPFTQRTYSRKIVAGWIYPAPNNWNLQRWKLTIHSMDVHDDSDSWGKGDGDWRFWANTNNGAKEWTKLFDCNDCVHGTEDWGGRPWTTGASDSERDLGPDLLLFPNQWIWVHTSGYEDDWTSSDSTGHVGWLGPQKAAEYSVRRGPCSSSSMSGCADYTLNFQIQEGLPVGNAVLSAAGQAIYDDYVITATPTHVTVLSRPLRRDWNHPVDFILSPNDPPVSIRDGGFFKSQGPEPRVITGMSVEEFKKGVLFARQTQPDRLDRMLKELREEADLAKDSMSTGDLVAQLSLLREAMPEDVWTEYFGDLFKVFLPVVTK
jgi:hypothetical protein